MTYRRWFVVGVAVAVVGVLVAAFAIFYGNFSPRGYVEDHYTRAASRDIGRDAVAYTAARQPSQVAKEITDAWQPADQYVDGSGVYLRYDDDSVVILPIAAGSLILLERMTTAYPRLPPRRRPGLGLGSWQHGTGRRPRCRQVARPTPHSGVSLCSNSSPICWSPSPTAWWASS